MDIPPTRPKRVTARSHSEQKIEPISTPETSGFGENDCEGRFTKALMRKKNPTAAIHGFRKTILKKQNRKKSARGMLAESKINARTNDSACELPRIAFKTSA